MMTKPTPEEIHEEFVAANEAVRKADRKYDRARKKMAEAVAERAAAYRRRASARNKLKAAISQDRRQDG